MDFCLENTAAPCDEPSKAEPLGEKELRLMADHSPIWIAFIDAQERFAYVNATCAAWLGRPARDILDRTIEEVSPESYGDLQPYVADALSGTEVAFERKVYYPDGVRRHVSIRFLPQQDDHAQVTGFYAFVVDLTRQNAAEVRITELERMEALGALAGGIAHDFNNLLTPIIGFLEMTLSELPKENPLHHNLSQVRRAAYRGKALVSEILLFSGKPAFHGATISLEPIAEEVAQLILATAPRNIILRRQVEDGLIHIRADQTQMHRLLMNLCKNAVDAMPDGGVLTLMLASVVVENLKCFAGQVISGPFLRIAVSDTGQGMARETLEQVFEPFFSTKSPRNGTGLGLATVFETVRSHHGHVNIASEPGRGTTFEVFLPVTAHTAGDAVPASLSA